MRYRATFKGKSGHMYWVEEDYSSDQDALGAKWFCYFRRSDELVLPVGGVRIVNQDGRVLQDF